MEPYGAEALALTKDPAATDRRFPRPVEPGRGWFDAFQTAIPALLHGEAYVTETPRTRVLLLSGLSGEKADTALALDALKIYLDGGETLTDKLALSAVPCANPDGMTQGVAPENGAGGRPAENYPPIVGFFNDRRNPEQRYLWRWIGLQAPDLILEVQVGEAVSWVSSASATLLLPTIEATRMEETAGSLLAALGSHMANGLGAVPGLRLTAPAAALRGGTRPAMVGAAANSRTAHLTGPPGTV